MPWRLTFMISLILLIGCTQEKPVALFNGPEAAIYDQILADYEAPDYKWGYININGQLIIKDEYDDLREFSEGLAAASKNGLWGYIDKSGNEIIPIRYRTVKTFSEGIAVAQDLLGNFHLFTAEGTLIADSLKYEDVSFFQDGKAMVENGHLFGFIDKNGDQIIAPEYEYASAFRDGIALVKRDKYGFIDDKGNIHLPLEYDKLWYPSEGMVRFKKEGRYGFLIANTGIENLNGYNQATDFQGDYAVVNDGNNYALLDKEGNKKILPYTFLDNGGENTWMYQADGKFGFLNNDGSILCLPQYDLVMRYQEGRAGFSIDDSWGYLDEDGKMVIPAKYPLAWDFVNGYARMISRYGFGFIDKNGNDILSPRYLEVRDFSEGLARIQVYR